MHTGLLGVLHDATDETRAGVVAQRVDVDLRRVLQEAIDERGSFGRQATLAAEGTRVRELGHGTPDVGVVVDDLHRATTEHVRRADQHRITDRVRDRHRFVGARRHRAVGLRDPEPVAQRVELLPVLGRVDRRRRGAEHRDAALLELVRQLQWGLTAEAHDDTANLTRLLQPFADVQHVFVRQRFEEQAVARVVVGRDRLGVAVDHHRLVTRVAQRERRVHAAVVELDALADPVGTAARG